MLLATKDGIMCDFCGCSYKDQFSYYSLRATEFKIVKNQKFPGKDARFNKDMCEACYDQLTSDIMKHIGPVKKGFIKDDLSTQYKTGTFDYWYVIVDRVEVDKERPEDQQIDVEKHVLDVNIIDHKSFKKRTEKIEEKVKKGGVWS